MGAFRTQPKGGPSAPLRKPPPQLSSDLPKGASITVQPPPPKLPTAPAEAPPQVPVSIAPQIAKTSSGCLDPSKYDKTEVNSCLESWRSLLNTSLKNLAVFIPDELKFSVKGYVEGYVFPSEEFGTLLSVFRNMLDAARKCGEICWQHLEILYFILGRPETFKYIEPGKVLRDCFVISDSTIGFGRDAVSFEKYSWSGNPSCWRGLCRRTLILQMNGQALWTLLDKVDEIITQCYGGDYANFTGIFQSFLQA